MTKGCPNEREVVRAARSDSWSDELRSHVASCDDCSATAAVAPWMARFAAVSAREHVLPDPSVIWLKARLLRGSVEAARAARPLDLIQLIAYTVVAGGWAALLTWRWDAVQAWLNGFTPSGLVQNAARADSLSMSFFAGLLVLASMTVMLALHTILAEE